MTEIFSTRTLLGLEKALEGTALRHRAIANNIANVDTPGYKRMEVYFEEELQRALSGNGIAGRRTHPAHLPIGSADPAGVTPTVVTDPSTSYRLDGNNVDIDIEMAKLAKNTLLYNALVQEVAAELGRLRTAITEGRK